MKTLFNVIANAKTNASVRPGVNAFAINLVAVCALMTCATATSFAQNVYRIVGTDGKVTFSDKPPVEANAKTSLGTASSGGGNVSSQLPFELRQVAQKYPVTLYTGDNCSPCQSARAMLSSRGVPFTEKTVNTNDDAQALQRLSGDNSLPFATIGGQQLKGYSDSEWTQFLNAAGYPATSILSANYRQGAATPMVAVSAAPNAEASASRAARAAQSAPVAAPAPAATNPAGIRF